VLGLDEACHPFVALGDQVWSRGRRGWVKTQLRSGLSIQIQALAGHRGTLYARYASQGDGMRVGVASARLAAE